MGGGLTEGNRAIVVQRRATSRARGGAVQTTWADHAPAWARIRQPHGREYFAGPLVEGRVATIFSIRYRDDVRPTDRVVWNGTPYDIHAVLDPDAGRRRLEIHASAEA